MDEYIIPLKTSLDYFAGMDFPIIEIKKVISNGIIEKYSSTDYFLHIGEVSRKIGLIKNGLFRIFYRDIEVMNT